MISSGIWVEVVLFFSVVGHKERLQCDRTSCEAAEGGKELRLSRNSGTQVKETIFRVRRNCTGRWCLHIQRSSCSMNA